MSKIPREPIPHDEYAAYLGDCPCQWCCRERDPEDRLEELKDERDEAKEWGGVDNP